MSESEEDGLSIEESDTLKLVEQTSSITDINSQELTDRQQEISPSPRMSWNGFKIVGDNVEKNVKPRYMRLHRQTCSLHYFNAYADRIDEPSYSSFTSHIDIGVDIESILPSDDIHSKLLDNLGVLVSRILVANMPVFKFYFEDVVQYRLEHMYSVEMSTKSEIVCAHVILRNFCYTKDFFC